jgi:hypothetical protein
MNGNSDNSGKKSWMPEIIIFLLVGGLIAASILEYCTRPGSHGNPMQDIFWNLRQIDDAKFRWADARGITNAVQLDKINLTEQELKPYLLGHFDNKDGLIHPRHGEHYKINSIWKHAEAELVNPLNGLPKGTTIIFDVRSNSVFDLYSLPKQQTNN